MPFPRGALRGTESLVLTNADGRHLPTQARALDYWSDGSVRWALLDSQVDWRGPGASFRLCLSPASLDAIAGSVPPLSIEERAGAILIDTGVARFLTRRAGSFPFDRITDAGGTDLVDAARSGLLVRTADGRTCVVAVDGVELEDRGPLRASLRWRGRFACGSEGTALEFDARAEVFAGLPVLRMRLTIRNRRPAKHRGNFWELGDAGSILLEETALVVAVAGSGGVSVECSTEIGSAMRPCGAGLWVYQESSGGENWNSRAHVNREGRVPMGMRGYSLRTEHGHETGLRASPVVTVRSGHSTVSATLPCFWQNFPRSLEVRESVLVLGLWPREFPDAHELQGGEQKTHEVVLAFGPDPVSGIPLDWCRIPAIVRAEPAWYCESGAVPHLVPDEADAPTYRSLVRSAVEGEDAFVSKRERIDEYGWRHFGDIYADHEAAWHRGDTPLVSHYNNQYDAVAGFAIQFMRSGDPRWWTQMCELAAHVVDIDRYHTTDDKAAYSGGPFWHTSHYVDAGRSTHRSYPRAPGVRGGGPGCEHNYTSGLLLHYFLTGRPDSREAVIQQADWVLQIDDGNRTPFRWIARCDTGLASATRDPGYHGPGRGAAYSTATLLDGYRVTGRQVYLAKAEQLIRRCIHPGDDLAGRRLLEAEERWSYTIFLQMLARYLDESAERGSGGDMYTYARESLLHYAGWMTTHERPYLDTPERLEYPTETWAAADMRKCEVLLVASLHARDAAGRQALRNRAAFFFTSSTQTLLGMATRTYARPVVILLTNGYRKAWFDRHAAAQATGQDGTAPCDFGAPGSFVPQRRRAISRLVWLAGAVAALGLIAGISAVMY